MVVVSSCCPAGGATPTIEVASSCGSDTTSTPKDALAESILGHPVMLAAAAANDTSMQTASAMELQHEHAGEQEYSPRCIFTSDVHATRDSLSSEHVLTCVRGHLVFCPAGLELGDDDMDVLRAASKLSSEGSLDGLHPAASDAASGEKTAGVAAGELSELSADGVELQDSDEVLSGMGILSGEIAMGLAGIKNWIMESLAALLQVWC